MKTVTTKTMNATSVIAATKKESKLSKAGQWLKDNPGGWFVIKDMKAVLK